MAAPLHGIWLAPLTAPFAWLAVAVRPRPLCSLPNVAIGPAFVVGNALMTRFPYRRRFPSWIAVSLAALVSCFLLRRRWWQRADHLL